MEALQPLLWGKAEAHFHAHRADDIFTALRIAKEFGLRAVIIHGTEAHLVADLLAEEHVPVVSGPYMTDRSKPEIRNLSDAAPGLLCKAGIHYGRSPGNSAAAAADGAYAGGARGYG